MKTKIIIKGLFLILGGGLVFWIATKDQTIATTLGPEKVAQDFMDWHWNRLQNIPTRRGVNPDENSLALRNEIADELKKELIKNSEKITKSSTYDLITCSKRQPLKIDFLECTQTEDEATVKFKKLYPAQQETEIILELKRINGIWQIVEIPCPKEDIEDELAKMSQIQLNK